MQAYSQDLRERVLRALERGERPSEIARRFEVTRIWVYQVKERFEKQGERCSRPMGSKRLSKAAQAKDDLCAWIAKEPDLTLEDLVERLQKHRGIAMRVHALWHQLNKWGLTFKKNAARKRARTNRRAASTQKLARKPTQHGQGATRFSG